MALSLRNVPRNRWNTSDGSELRIVRALLGHVMSVGMETGDKLLHVAIRDLGYLGDGVWIGDLTTRLQGSQGEGREVLVWTAIEDYTKEVTIWYLTDGDEPREERLGRVSTNGGCFCWHLPSWVREIPVPTRAEYFQQAMAAVAELPPDYRYAEGERICREAYHVENWWVVPSLEELQAPEPDQGTEDAEALKFEQAHRFGGVKLRW